MTFSGNTASSGSSSAEGGAIYGETITLSNNGSVTFSGNTASSGSVIAEGGAIDGNTITLSHNGCVTFSGNTAFSSSYSVYGGAIGGDTITLSNNGSVTFSGNTASGSYSADGGAIDGNTITLSHNGSVTFSGNTASSGSDSAEGGAIEGGTITLSNNGSVTFSGNTASSGSDSAEGGAIDGGTITLSNNGSVTFSGNTASSGSDAVVEGGAIYGGTITLSHNGSVTFSGNTATGGSSFVCGGAIFADFDSPLKINNNGETIFRGNYAHSPVYGACGGAIYKPLGIFSIQNNASVVFEKNYALQEGTLRLQSIYAYAVDSAGTEKLVNFSAPKGGKIEFRDSIYIDVGSNSASAFHLNNWYVDDAGERVAQTGDIIFTGEDATAENLKAILAEHGIHREATADEIRFSKTSEVRETMQLHDGRLIVRDGAIIYADGITVHGSASGESTPTLWLDNGELTSYFDSFIRKNAVTISEGSALRLSGQNTARYSTLTLSAGSTFIIDVAAAHTTTAALTLNSSTLSLGGTITLQLNAAEGLNTAGRYMLLSGVSAPTDWVSNITVSGGVWTIDDLSWVNNTLYLNFPTLTEATWNNQSGDRLWNVNSSVNWEQHDIDYAYKDGIGVIFGDEGAGKVTLVGTLTPASVLVNSTGNYSFEGSGSLSGGMTLTKQGSGTLSISTANSYTGGTMIEAGTVVAKHAAALGTGTVTLAGGTLEIAVTGVGNIIANTGTSTLKVANGRTHGLTGTIANSGELTLIGNFDASKLDKSELADVYVDVLGNETVDGSGFTRSGDFTVSIANGTVDSTGASVSYKGTTLEMNGGVGLIKGGMFWGEYRILSGHEVELSAIVNKAADNLVSTTDIQLNGGKLTADRALTGTLSISGTSTLHGVDFNLGNAPLQNSGDLTLTGSFDASGLSKSKTWNSYVTTSNEVSTAGSGFLREGDFEVTVVDGTGTVDSSGVTAMKYGEQNLTLDGAIGSGVGAMQYETYRILSGHEVELSAIVDKAADNQVSATDIQLNGGKLTANRALTGTLSISGTSALHGVDFNLGNAPLQNNGDLTLTGSFDASGLSKSKTWNSYVTTSNEESTDGSGFLREGDFEVTVVTGTGTVVSSGVTVMKYGSQNLTMNGAIGAGVGEMQYDTYRILSGHTASSSAIHGYDEGKGMNALITLADGGTLNADDATTETKVSAMGGSINLSAGTLSGTVGGSTIVTVIGTATMSGGNSYTGGTTLNGATLTITHANALGTGAIETRGNSSLEVKGVTLALGSTINHSATGTLSLSGNIDASALEKSDSDDVFVDVYGAETKNGSGFVRSGDFTVTVVDEGTVDSSAATIIWNGTSLTMNNGVGSAKGGMLYGTYRILTGHTASSTAIHGYDSGAGANAVVTLVAGGTLNADDANGVNVTATGGTINLSAGALSGNWTNATVNAAGGSLAGSFDGISTLAGTGFVLGNTAVQNNGTLMLSGSFDASGLVSTATGKDMFVDTSNNVTENGSGFRRTEDFTVLVATGTVDSSNAVVTYGGQTLTMTDGTGFGVGSIQYDTYLLKGDDTATVSTIATKAGAALQKIDMQGGTLNVNASTDKLVATGGSIVLSAGTLGGSIGGTAAVTVSGIASISGNNSYTGGTVIDGGSLTITHANALGTGGIVTTGDSKLVVSGVTLVLGDSIANTGKLTLKGSIDASGLTLNRTEEGRLALSGTKVSLAESGFARGVEYSVQIVEGGTTVNDGVSISHRDYLSRTQLVLGADGVARAGGAVDYTHFFLTGGDSAVVSEIADVSKLHQETLARVTMDSGSLEVDRSMAVNATGGSIDITKAATLSGSIEDTAVSTAADDYSCEISALLKGDTTLEVNGGSVTVSGDNSYSGGTVVNGGSLLAGHDKAFGTGDVTVNSATLDLNRFSIANKVRLNGNSTLGHADGAAHIVLGGGSKVNFRDGYALSAGKTLEVAAAGATYAGALTLGGGTLELDGLLTVQGDVTFESGTQTTLDISGWRGADDGEVLVDFGSSTSGYTEESLKLAGIAGDWELDFDAATGVLTLVEVKDEPLPEPEFSPSLNRNQQVVYDTIKDIMGEENPGGLLGELGKDVTGTRDEEKLKQLLDELGGAEYATLLSSQQAAARGHMRRLRGEMGSGHLLAGSKTRAYIEAYNHRSEVDGDAHGRGYELNESGGQFALEFLGEDSVSGGFAVAAGRSKLQPDGGMTQKSDNTYMDAFLLHRDGAYTGKFALGVGVHKYDLDRSVAGNAVNADASGTSVNFMHESAWAMSLSESHSVQVFGAVESSFNKLGAFHEKDAGTASLQVESQDAWVTTLSLGARYLYSFAALESAPAATLSVQGGLEFDFGDTESEVEMNFEGARSHRFRQSGAERDTFGYNLGASLHLPVSAKAAIYASGDAVLRGDSYEVNANVGLQMAF